MSFGHGHSHSQSGSSRQGLGAFYDTLSHNWPGIEASSYVNPNNPYSTAAFPATSILTPISLPDSSFANARTSPVLSHHSQEYQHSLSDPAHQHHHHHHQHGLGITAAFPGDYPQAVAPAGLGYPSEVMEHHPNDTRYSPSQPPAKRQRRGGQAHRHYSHTPSGRDAPVNILPDPEGLHRLQQEQQRRGQAEAQTYQRPRAPGRGRKDPQAEEEDVYVEQLREQSFAWKAIREMFRQKFHKDASEARLQMRLLRRRKERLARWDENDIQLLIRARDWWEVEKYKQIAQKMKELGSRKEYTARQCELQLNVLDEERQEERKDPALGSSISAPVPSPLPPPRLPHLPPSQQVCPEHEYTRRIAPAAGPRERVRVTHA